MRPMPAGVPNPRLEPLYEISKLFTSFESVEGTFDAALAIIAGTLPIESAILIEAEPGHTDMVVWPSEISVPERLRSAKAHAKAAYGYLVGAQELESIDLREDMGATVLRAPNRDGSTTPRNRFIVLPLVVGRHPVFGALQLEGAAQLDRDDLEFVNAVTNQLSIALDRARARITEVQQRREAERLQAKYELLLDDLDDTFVWQADVDTRHVTYVSAQFARLFGVRAHPKLDDENWWDAIVPPEDRARLAETFDRAREERGSKHCDHRCVTANGAVRWMHTAIHLVIIPGEPDHFQGVSFDVTTARLAQELVSEQLAFTSAMASSIGEGTLAIGLDGAITFIVAMQTGQRVRSDAHMLHRTDGVRFAVTYTASPIRRDGRITGAVIAFDDITERRQAQETAQFLIEAGVALSASLESSVVARTIAMLGVPLLGEICLVDVAAAEGPSSRVVWAPSLLAAPDELDLEFGVAQPSPVFAAAVAQVITTSKPLQFSIGSAAALSSLELALSSRHGIGSVLIVPLTLGSRKIGALTFCSTTERGHDDHVLELAEALALRSALAIEHARLFEQARHAVALRDQTLAIVSHDLRAPLATIVMASSILGDADLATDPRTMARAVGKIQIAADRMERMIGDLLDFASIEAGRLAIVTRPQEVEALLYESIASFEQAARASQIKLTAMTELGMPLVQCDRDRILQVIGNLVSNALKSVKPGDQIALSARVVEGVAIFSVADTGLGIAHADQQRLFDRYWRGQQATYKGTGLGLAIAQGIVAAHGGTIWVDSEPGGGATFFFTVPLTR